MTTRCARSGPRARGRRRMGEARGACARRACHARPCHVRSCTAARRPSAARIRHERRDGSGAANLARGERFGLVWCRGAGGRLPNVRAPCPAPAAPAVRLQVHQVLLRRGPQQLHRGRDRHVPVHVPRKVDNGVRVPVQHHQPGLLLRDTAPVLVAGRAAGVWGAGPARAGGARRGRRVDACGDGETARRRLVSMCRRQAGWEVAPRAHAPPRAPRRCPRSPTAPSRGGPSPW
jgi:hypothetical protein